MNQYLEVLEKCLFFDGFEADKILEALSCLESRVRTFEKNTLITLFDEEISSFGIILSGSVHIIMEDYLGNKNIIAELAVSEIFAETFVFAGIEKSPVSVLSITESEVLFVNAKNIVSICQLTCSFHAKLVGNMLKIIAKKNLQLNQKNEILSKRTIREKLLSYFNIERSKTNSKQIVIPFTRQGLADFLCIDRSSMSRELCKLRDDGIVHFHKNSFEFFH